MGKHHIEAAADECVLGAAGVLAAAHGFCTRSCSPTRSVRPDWPRRAGGGATTTRSAACGAGTATACAARWTTTTTPLSPSALPLGCGVLSALRRVVLCSDLVVCSDAPACCMQTHCVPRHRVPARCMQTHVCVSSCCLLLTLHSPPLPPAGTRRWRRWRARWRRWPRTRTAAASCRRSLTRAAPQPSPWSFRCALCCVLVAGCGIASVLLDRRVVLRAAGRLWHRVGLCFTGRRWRWLLSHCLACFHLHARGSQRSRAARCGTAGVRGRREHPIPRLPLAAMPPHQLPPTPANCHPTPLLCCRRSLRSWLT